MPHRLEPVQRGNAISRSPTSAIAPTLQPVSNRQRGGAMQSQVGYHWHPSRSESWSRLGLTACSTGPSPTTPTAGASKASSGAPPLSHPIPLTPHRASRCSAALPPTRSRPAARGASTGAGQVGRGGHPCRACRCCDTSGHVGGCGGCRWTLGAQSNAPGHLGHCEHQQDVHGGADLQARRGREDQS